MTRIKKRRTGKKRTADQKRLTAGRKRGRAAANTAPAGEPPRKETISAEEKAAYKKSFQPEQSGRRNRSSKKDADVRKAGGDLSGHQKNEVPAKATGKTRSAGSRRVAVAKSVATNAKGKPAYKKAFTPKKEITGEEKSPRGFAPWNKNKARKKGLGK